VSNGGFEIKLTQKEENWKQSREIKFTQVIEEDSNKIVLLV
jgi:hypothetical protein